jgi:hypothetical protein
MVGYGDGYYRAAHSADGLHWKPYAKEKILQHGDTITLTRNPWNGDYLVFHKRPAEVRGFPRRVVWLSSSRDFQNWSEPELILAPDEVDDRWAKAPEQRTEFYTMSGFPYGGQFLGLLSVFKVKEIKKAPGRMASPWDGPVDIQLVHSRDGRRWERLEQRTPIISCGELGSFDGGMILGVANAPVIYNDEVWVYYTAYNTTHGGPMPPKRAVIGRASWRLDGFVSLDAGPSGGYAETVPLQGAGGRLYVNADAREGNLTVEALTLDGKVLPGFSSESCEEIRSDSVRHLVRWKGKDSLAAGKNYRLRFKLKNAKLYSFTINAEE